MFSFINRNKPCPWSNYQLTVFVLIAISGITSSKLLDGLTVKNCGKSVVQADSYDRIVGGTDAQPGEFPWMVSLRMDDDFGFEHGCGATILNENWIVTAAHCIDLPPSPSMYEVVVGLNKFSKEKDATVKRYKISKIEVHDKYDDDTYLHDIALLKTSIPIDISRSNGYINGICLPKDKKDPTGFATVIGWGHTKEDGIDSDTLQKVLIPLIERDLCNESYDDNLNDGIDEVTEAMICAGNIGKDSCQNDSGGPLFQTDKNGISTLIGIVSHGGGCGRKYFPGVYTKISMYKDWMNKIMS